LGIAWGLGIGDWGMGGWAQSPNPKNKTKNTNKIKKII